jgi:hypothetical protein
MGSVVVYDPEMCCSTGLCGPAPDAALIGIEEALRRLQAEGVSVARYQLSRNPQAFLEQAEVYRRLLEQGPASLPMVAVDGVVRFVGRYPSYEALREALHLAGQPGKSE